MQGPHGTVAVEAVSSCHHAGTVATWSGPGKRIVLPIASSRQVWTDRAVAGAVASRSGLDALRPCETGSMRVAEIAELTGTTVRTVRYYHSLGLLPVPAERGGWRDYDLSHVARLSRIRLLVQAGVPLETTKRILDDPEVTVVENLTGALTAVEEHLVEVTRQRDMLAGLLERARAGSMVSPMSPRMAAFFDRMEQAAPDEATRTAVRRERDLTDLACYRGKMPPEAEFLFANPDTLYDAESLALYSQDPAELSDAQIEQRAQVTISRLEARLTPERLEDLADSVDTNAVRSLFRLIAGIEYLDPRLAQALEREFLAAIDRWRTSIGP